jgi:hypothetical protein
VIVFAEEEEGLWVEYLALAQDEEVEEDVHQVPIEA